MKASNSLSALLPQAKKFGPYPAEIFAFAIVREVPCYIIAVFYNYGLVYFWFKFTGYTD
jgi:hypothetical protein